MCIYIHTHTHTLHCITCHYMTWCSSLPKPSFWKSQPATKAATLGNSYQEPHWFSIGSPLWFYWRLIAGKSPLSGVCWKIIKLDGLMMFNVLFLLPGHPSICNRTALDLPFQSTLFHHWDSWNCYGLKLDANILDDYIPYRTST